MLKRKIQQYLEDWYGKDKRKALIVEGPRRVGKTTSVIDFVRRRFPKNQLLHVDFEQRRDLIDLFEYQLDAERIVQSLRIHFPDFQPVKGHSILVFDNIQYVPRAIVALRSFVTYGTHDVIAIGTYLEEVYESLKAFPVGYVERYHMGSLDFEEFLWANGHQHDMVEVLRSHYHMKEPLLAASHTVFLNLFREYMAIGGMPEVVSTYLPERDYQLAYSKQEDLLEWIQQDIERQCTRNAGEKINDCLLSLPIQLYRDNKKFQYSAVQQGGRKATYENHIQWLVDAGIVLRAHNVTEPQKPLHTHQKDDVFKLYLHDHGLFVAMLGDEIQLEILRGGIDAYNGAILESVIASMFSKLGQTLYYFEKQSKLQVDFLITIERELYAVEVKTADHPKSKVLASLRDNHGVPHGIRLSTHNLSVEEDVWTLPIYLAMFLERS
jgi:predicted AAA+ superfamily ATPase